MSDFLGKGNELYEEIKNNPENYNCFHCDEPLTKNNFTIHVVFKNNKVYPAHSKVLIKGSEFICK